MKEKIIEKVLEERERQDAKWGEQNHAAPVWGMIIGEEYGEMCQAINEFGFNPTPEAEEQIYTEAIHTMASCMAMIECIERRRSTMKNGEVDMERLVYLEKCVGDFCDHTRCSNCTIREICDFTESENLGILRLYFKNKVRK